jgi:hypothetical protein
MFMTYMLLTPYTAVLRDTQLASNNGVTSHLYDSDGHKSVTHENAANAGADWHTTLHSI